MCIQLAFSRRPKEKNSALKHRYSALIAYLKTKRYAMHISLATALFALNTAMSRYSAYRRGAIFSDEFFISPLYFWAFWPSNQAYIFSSNRANPNQPTERALPKSNEAAVAAGASPVSSSHSRPPLAASSGRYIASSGPVTSWSLRHLL